MTIRLESLDAPVGPPAPSRPERRRARRIKGILTATAEVLAERGYYETSLDEIAERLDLSKASLYHYFESRDALVMACLERVATETNTRLAEIADGPGTAPQRLRRLVTAQTMIATRDCPDGARLFAQPMIWPETFRTALRGMRETHDHIFQRVIEDGLRSGEFELEDPEVGRHCLHGALNYLGVWTRSGQSVPDATLAAMTEILLRMFVPCPSASTIAAPQPTDT